MLPSSRATRDADLIGPADGEQIVEHLVSALGVDLRNTFTFEIRRASNADPDSPEPPMQLHVSAWIGGNRCDEAVVIAVFAPTNPCGPREVISALPEVGEVPAVPVPVPARTRPPTYPAGPV